MRTLNITTSYLDIPTTLKEAIAEEVKRVNKLSDNAYYSVAEAINDIIEYVWDYGTFTGGEMEELVHDGNVYICNERIGYVYDLLDDKNRHKFNWNWR